MKKRLSPQTLGLDVALIMLALLIAGCGGAIGPANTAAPADGPTPVDSAIAELDSLIDSIGSDILSIAGDLTSDAAATAVAMANG